MTSRRPFGSNIAVGSSRTIHRGFIAHYMEEVIDADRVVVIDGGHVVMDGTPKEVFSRVKELKKYSLDVPQVTELADELKEAGMDLPYGILSIDELVDELVPLLK